ncbi:phage tail protein [Chitinophaga pinensis]|uniref:Tail Collar domain protein n=1 Tax=Chitinophaga pinensis (strain ATCC 43595 / DSM 2588 / LMG 13176 / NBRC 15968 / NCIMB 11800 / UQM 2034) TaxID=485918 RepID=A0A979G7G5_CHIPD|nr:tail fiber protein [Chitinophaga pinensis]ACU62334.1 Tail Collar domain protein [Chitinophaga pinensis DSM 2588]
MDNYLGEIRLFAGNFAPVNWNVCNGALLAISQYDALFSLIGTQYGGDGITTFALPDLRVRVPISMGQISASGGTGNYVLGQAAGTPNITLLTSNIPNHTHPLVAVNATATTGDPVNNMLAVTNGNNNTGPTAYPDVNLYTTLPLPGGGTTIPNALMDPASISPTGGTQAHDNMMPYVTINYIIALYGIYPSH